MLGIAYSLRHFALLKLKDVIQPHRLEKKTKVEEAGDTLKIIFIAGSNFAFWVSIKSGTRQRRVLDHANFPRNFTQWISNFRNDKYETSPASQPVTCQI